MSETREQRAQREARESEKWSRLSELDRFVHSDLNHQVRQLGLRARTEYAQPAPEVAVAASVLRWVQEHAPQLMPQTKTINKRSKR